jgi:DNA-binding LacI/PurR family transcriptional regulator
MDDVPSLQDIARISGYSKSTVSLALRSHPRIPERTRKGILEVAAKLGYRPDPALAIIAAKRWRRVPYRTNLAFVTTNHPDGGLLDGESLAGARRRAEDFGYQIVQFPFEDYGSAKRMGEVIYSRGIKGVIIGKLSQASFLSEFPWQHFAAVGCDAGFVRPPIQLVMPDHAHAVHRAWHEAAARGYQRIGLALFDEYTAIDYFDKLSAYLFNQRVLPQKNRLKVGHFSPLLHRNLKSWIEEQKPDVVLGFNPVVHYWLTQLGYQIPRDFGFIALMWAKTAELDIARLQEDAVLVGKNAVEQLDILLRTHQFGLPRFVTRRLIESEWIPGSTLPDRKREGRQAARSVIRVH